MCTGPLMKPGRPSAGTPETAAVIARDDLVAFHKTFYVPSNAILAVVGDVKHSRVARSNVLAFTMLGAQVTIVAPPTLLPPSLDGWPVEVSHDLDGVLAKSDVVYLLRMQAERQTEANVSWVASSARPRSPSRRSASAKTGRT